MFENPPEVAYYLIKDNISLFTMNIEVFNYPVPFCLIRNFLTTEQHAKVKQELNGLKPHLQGAEFTGPAKNQNELSVKRKGIFLHEFTCLQGNSGINSIFDRVMDPILLEELVSKSWICGYLTYPPRTGTLVSLYGEGDEYKYHKDKSVLSIIYYVFDGEFEGGDFYLRQVKVPIDNNSLIIFPSCIHHAVSPITGPGQRWAITTFVNLKGDDNPMLSKDIMRFRNFLSKEEWSTVQETIQRGLWSYQGRSNAMDAEACKFLYMDLTQNPFFSEFLFKKIPHGPWELERVYANGQTTGLNGDFHKDSDSYDGWTFMIYASEINTAFLDKWGGQTEFETEHGRISQTPEPNMGILFKSDIFHRGLAPSRYVNAMRVTIAWKLKKK
jgi:2OG-Fe(II) oxygenase superfamily